GTLLVQKARRAVAWNAPAAIAYGTPLSSTQLDATANVPGTFIYSPAAGTVLHAGNAQTLSVTFTPTDSANYATAGATTTIDVSKAPATIAWAAPAPIVYGTALSSTQLDATASTPGSFTYSPAAGTVLDAGSHTLTATFTPSDTADFQGGSASVTIDVAKAEQTIQWSNPADIVYGTPLSSTQLNATVNGPGTLTYTPAA